jgi:hypothetical protein
LNYWAIPLYFQRETRKNLRKKREKLQVAIFRVFRGDVRVFRVEKENSTTLMLHSPDFTS